MKKIVQKIKNNRGNVTIVALMILVILTLMGISASSTSNTDVLAARNQIPYMQDFYIIEGAQNKEAAKISRGDYPVAGTENPGLILEKSTGEIITGSSYEYEISYKGAFSPPAGYSILHFNRFDYGVKTRIKKTGLTINARYFTIGPKAD